MTLIKTNAVIDTSQDLCLQLTFEPDAAVLHSPDHPNMPSVRIAFSHADLEARFFPQGQLSPLHLERAIEWVEDHIQAAHPDWPKGTKLFTNEADLQTLASVAGVSEGAERLLHVDAVEQTFSRLVMQAMGQAPHQEALPYSARVFASVVFVRELMHHLHFLQILVLSSHCGANPCRSSERSKYHNKNHI
jgi:hypothetical protein